MRNDNGVSIVLADSESEVNRLLATLGVSVAHPLSSLQDVCLTEPDAVFTAVLDSQTKMERLTQFLTVRRGVMSFQGKRKFIGFNVDWMTRVLVTDDLDRAITVAAQPPVEPVRTMPKPVLVVVNDEERDDPYAELGYGRR
jgi:hypothetical protein